MPTKKESVADFANQDHEKGKDMRKEIKTFHIKDVDCTIEIEIMSTQEDIFDWLDQYIDNLKYDWFDATDESFQILYKNGTVEYIDSSSH